SACRAAFVRRGRFTGSATAASDGAAAMVGWTGIAAGDMATASRAPLSAWAASASLPGLAAALRADDARDVLVTVPLATFLAAVFLVVFFAAVLVAVLVPVLAVPASGISPTAFPAVFAAALPDVFLTVSPATPPPDSSEEADFFARVALFFGLAFTGISPSG